ncbi:MAG: hypothetical protein BGO25_09645 [Acidobacteriales bacterium 59-55]|nr:permease [Terriglobales bacterium]OJV40041.1 MAG: hypothetical protein BGO25_09645 [Acidobacteriales bacterium 59-55]
MRFRILNPRRPSPLRGSILVLTSLAAAYLLSGFPDTKPSILILIPALVALVGSADTYRCVSHPRWDLYHAGVLLMLYMDLLSIFMILFLLFYPYMLWLTGAH